MLDNLNIDNLLFLDIETVPGERSFEDWSDKMRALWEKKSAYFRKEGEEAKDVFQRAGIYSEFGKIICISVGYSFYKEGGRIFRTKSFAGHDEKILLTEFSQMLEAFEAKVGNLLLCAHNGKEFDFPYIARRMLIRGVELPKILDMAGKKPWEIPFIDTMELWKFGDYKNYTSLDLLATIFDIPTPKDDIDGSMVAQVYYEEDNLDRIVEYCEKDTLTVAQLILRYKGEPIIKDENVFKVP